MQSLDKPHQAFPLHISLAQKSPELLHMLFFLKEKSRADIINKEKQNTINNKCWNKGYCFINTISRAKAQGSPLLCSTYEPLMVAGLMMEQRVLKGGRNFHLGTLQITYHIAHVEGPHHYTVTAPLNERILQSGGMHLPSAIQFYRKSRPPNVP